jgi:hypothetical protein
MSVPRPTPKKQYFICYTSAVRPPYVFSEILYALNVRPFPPRGYGFRWAPPLYVSLYDHLHVNLFHQHLTDDLGVLQPRMLHDLLCRDPLLLAVLEKLGDQILGRPGDGVEKLRVELVVGGGDLSPVLKLQTSSVIPK